LIYSCGRSRPIGRNVEGLLHSRPPCGATATACGETTRSLPSVIPAKAGIQGGKTTLVALDARFRGHDDKKKRRPKSTCDSPALRRRELRARFLPLTPFDRHLL